MKKQASSENILPTQTVFYNLETVNALVDDSSISNSLFLMYVMYNLFILYINLCIKYIIFSKYINILIVLYVQKIYQFYIL
jgi:hypothetical protein